MRYGAHPSEWEQEKDYEQCGNCGELGHKLRTCMGPLDPNGFLRGCPHCNTRSHNLENCPSADLSKGSTLVHYYINSRSNRPPLYCTRDFRDLTLFGSTPFRPWTVQYSLENARHLVSHVYRAFPKDEVTHLDPAWDHPERIPPGSQAAGYQPPR